MSIFTKPISQLDASDLQELVDDKAVENVRLEFKSQVPDKDETLKKLSSFANTYGGIMVVGAKASSADGRIEDLPGVDDQPGYKQKVVDWCFNGASPPLTVFVSDPIPAGTGKVCYVVRIDESDVAPHFLNGRKGVWVRTDEFSSRFEARLADENELRHLLDRRKLILERRVSLLARARSRFAKYGSRKLGQLVVPKKTHLESRETHLEIFFSPRFPSRQLCEHFSLKQLTVKNSTHWRGVLFPNPNTVVSQNESAIVLAPTVRKFSYFEVSIWGSLFYGTGLVNPPEGGTNTHGIHLYEFVGHILLFIHHAAVMLKAVGYSGPVEIETSLVSIARIPWLYSSQFYNNLVSKQGSELDEDVRLPVSTSTDELASKPDAVAKDILRYVFFSIDWADQVDTPQKLDVLLDYGYRYNSWAPSLAGF